MKTDRVKDRRYLGVVEVENDQGFTWSFSYAKMNSSFTMLRKGVAKSLSQAWNEIEYLARKASAERVRDRNTDPQTRYYVGVLKSGPVTCLPWVTTDSYSNGTAIVAVCVTDEFNLKFKDSTHMGQKNGIVIEFCHADLLLMAEALRNAATKLEEDFNRRIGEGLK